MERIMVVNLKKAYEKPRTKRRQVAIKLLREIAARHSKSDYFNVKIDNSVTKEIYKNGSRFPLKRIKVKMTKDEKTGIVMVTLPETEMKKEKIEQKEKKGEKKEQKKEEKKKE
ncbi:MAG: 50S ribosomal protein L31e [Candidatus Micrarchaeia archaeon]